MLSRLDSLSGLPSIRMPSWLNYKSVKISRTRRSARRRKLERPKREDKNVESASRSRRESMKSRNCLSTRFSPELSRETSPSPPRYMTSETITRSNQLVSTHMEDSWVRSCSPYSACRPTCFPSQRTLVSKSSLTWSRRSWERSSLRDSQLAQLTSECQPSHLSPWKWLI